MFSLLIFSQQLETRGFNWILADFKEMLRVGMTTMQDKLQNVTDDLLALRLVELWTFFFGSVLPYLEGVFEPMAAESEKSLRIDLGDSTPSSFIRDLSLAACRDYILKPTLDRLERAHFSFSIENSEERANMRCVLNVQLSFTQASPTLAMIRGPSMPCGR